MTNNNAKDKYLRFLAGGVQIHIERAGKTFTDFLSYKKNNGAEKTIERARRKRDEAYLSMYGTSISSRFFHLVKRSNSNDSLPPGISIGKSRGKELYIVASWCRENGTVARKRFNINKLSKEQALKDAISFRQKKTADHNKPCQTYPA